MSRGEPIVRSDDNQNTQENNDSNNWREDTILPDLQNGGD